MTERHRTLLRKMILLYDKVDFLREVEAAYGDLADEAYEFELHTGIVMGTHAAECDGIASDIELLVSVIDGGRPHDGMTPVPVEVDDMEDGRFRDL